MNALVRFSAAALAALALAAAPALGGGPHAPHRPAAANPKEIDRMIDGLATISRQDVGYSQSVSGGGFAPLGAREPGAMLLGQEPSQESSTFTAIVAQGIAAAPALLAHLGDARPTALPEIKHEMGMGGMFIDAEYDRNERTTPAVPTGTCLGDVWAKDPRHTITVGDLCFVALGQIVNRSWSAVRYQPTACIMISSPVRSPALRDAVLAEWGGLTEERHRAALLADVRMPDDEERLVQALVRLAYYYPDAFAAPAVEALRRRVRGPSDPEAEAVQSTYELASLLEALARFPSKDVDEEAWRMFRSLGEPPYDDDTADMVALACAHRLRGKGGDAELKAYCEKPRSSGVDAKALRELAKTLR